MMAQERNFCMEAEKKPGISGSTLKMIAMTAMLVDHIGAGVVGRMIMSSGFASAFPWSGEYSSLVNIYWIMRVVGRLAFPIFCFLLVEGFLHTANVKKYVARLCLFCLVSEIPFDLLFNGAFLEFGYQNVFFTLLIGLLCMCVCRYIERQAEWRPLVRALCGIAALLAGIAAAEFMRTDYAGYGIVSILALYAFRKRKAAQIAAGCCTFLWELPALLAFLPIGFYNGRRGWRLKYFFYFFYPAHLLLLYLICALLGISGFAAM